MKSLFEKNPKLKKVATIITIVLAILIILSQTIFGEIFLKYSENYFEKIVNIYKIERMKNMTVSQVNFETDANFILNNFKEATYSGDLKNITRDDLKRMKIREARISDLPAIVAMHNKGLNKGVWCPLPYKTSAWAMIKAYYDFKKQYGDNNILINVAEIDGKLVAVNAGIQDGEKAVNLFLFIDVDIPENLWTEILVKVSLPFYELARERNLNILEAKIAKGVWFEGFVRDVMKAKEMKAGTWHFDRDFILGRKWTEADFAYDNDAVKLTEKRNANGGNPIVQEEKIDDVGKIFSQTENSDTYQLKKGQREVIIYPSPVNIKVNNKWIKIDDYLKQPEETSEDTLSAGKQYQMAPFDVYAGADDNNKNIIKYNNSDNQISFSLENISYKDQDKNIVLANSEVGNFDHSYKSGMFKDIFQGVDLKYHSTRNGIKEELLFNNQELLKEVSDPDYFGGKITLRMKINVSPNIVPEIQNNQVFFRKNGEIIFSTSQPYIYDQEKRTSAVSSELKKEVDYYLETSLDYGWMTSDEKVYPLVLDPNLNLNPAADVCLCTDSTCTTSTDSTYAAGKAFIKFNISSIPSYSTLTAANLILTHSTNYASTITASRFINQTWDESSALSIFTGGSFGSTLSTVTSGSGTTETWNVLGNSSDGLVKDYNSGNTYFSVYLLNTGATFIPGYVSNATTLILSYYYFSKAAYIESYYSREGTTPPVLAITYTLPVCGDGICNGIETNATCPADCPPVSTSNKANSTILNYKNYPVGAKSIINAPGTTTSVFRQ